MLEIFMVLILLGILSTIAYTQFMKLIEKSRGNNARIILRTIRTAQLRYYAENETFAKKIEDLDIESIKGTKFEYGRYFSFKIESADDKGFTASAVRLSPSPYQGAKISLILELDENTGEIKTDKITATNDIYEEKD